MEIWDANILPEKGTDFKGNARVFAAPQAEKAISRLL
jgi:hypothetical protein